MRSGRCASRKLLSAMVQPDNQLAQLLAERIRQDGPMTVADFMSAALTEPSLGYYMTGDPFGAAGDFITAPEISQIFGELIGLWCAQAWQEMGAPSRINLVELGPGRGTLMADALRAARVLPAFREAIRIHLVETSPSLKARQKETLTGEEVSWHRDLSSLPHAPMIVIANEFFDALPVRQLERGPDVWFERLVALSPVSTDTHPAFAFTRGVATAQIVEMIPAGLRRSPAGTFVEISPAVTAVAGDLAQRLAKEGGLALIIDYGRAQQQAGWSLQALRSHERHAPLIAPGTADLTAHVDFQSLAETAEAAGAKTWGAVTQGAFLRALGIRERAEALGRGASHTQAKDLDLAVQRLTDGEQMGELFKVMAFGHPALPTPAGLPISSTDSPGVTP